MAMFNLNHAYRESYKISADHTSNKAFPGLLRGELDEWGLAKQNSEDIGHDIIGDYAELRKNKPEDSLVDVVRD
jgi:hypothetical protein